MTAPAPDEAELTIVTVVLEKHYPYLAEQLRLIDALNPGASIRYLVVDNSAAGGASRLEVGDDRVRVIAGVSPEPFPAEGRGSYHHSAALHLALPLVATRHLLIIDPDLFVVRADWVAECLAHMRRRRLIFFGVPWHYSWVRKWRYFPCVHFLLIDGHRLDGPLDFAPAVADDRRWLQSPLALWLKRHMPLLHARLLIESRRDTGWRLHRNYRGRRGAYEAASPVLDLDRELTRPKYLRTRLARWLEPRLPRRWSFFPRAGTFVEAPQAPMMGRPDLAALSPECFYWKGAPFAIHLRRNMRDKEKGRTGDDEARDWRLLQDLLQDVAASRGLR